MDTLEYLRKFDFLNSTPDDVRKLYVNLRLLVVFSDIKEGVYILRGRRGEGYTKRSEMTYRPVKDCHSYQRASLPGHTMFYGVISEDQSHLESARAIIASECSKLCREGNSPIGRETFSVAQWIVKKPLYIASFINETTFPQVKDNVLLNSLRNAFESFCQRCKTTDLDISITRLISMEFSKVVKNENEYLLSATIANDIIEGMDVDGIVYPSVQLSGQGGLNIALTPKAVDNKLRFMRTLEQTLYMNGEQSILRTEKVDGELLPYKEIPDNIIEGTLNIRSISDLPFIK